MKGLFTDHPATVGETYFQHLGSASYFALNMFLGALACLVHGLLPCLFEKTGSGRVAHLHDRMIINRSRLPKATRVDADDADTFSPSLPGGAS